MCFSIVNVWIRPLPAHPEVQARGCTIGADDNISMDVVRRLKAHGKDEPCPAMAVYILFRNPDTVPV